MRTLFKHFLVDTLSLYVISLSVSGMIFEKGIYTLLLAGFVLMLTTLVIKPIINVLLLPLTLVTFGLFKWVAYAVTLYLVTLIVPGFKLLDFAFKGLSSYWFVIPSITLNGAWAFLAFSLLISFISSIIYWVLK